MSGYQLEVLHAQEVWVSSLYKHFKTEVFEELQQNSSGKHHLHHSYSILRIEIQERWSSRSWTQIFSLIEFASCATDFVLLQLVNELWMIFFSLNQQLSRLVLKEFLFSSQTSEENFCTSIWMKIQSHLQQILFKLYLLGASASAEKRNQFPTKYDYNLCFAVLNWFLFMLRLLAETNMDKSWEVLVL